MRHKEWKMGTMFERIQPVGPSKRWRGVVAPKKARGHGLEGRDALFSRRAHVLGRRRGMVAPKKRGARGTGCPVQPVGARFGALAGDGPKKASRGHGLEGGGVVFSWRAHVLGSRRGMVTGDGGLQKVRGHGLEGRDALSTGGRTFWGVGGGWLPSKKRRVTG